MKLALAVLFAFSLGALTRCLAPPKISGVLLILAVTVGYLATDRLLGGPEEESPAPPAAAGASD